MKDIADILTLLGSPDPEVRTIMKEKSYELFGDSSNSSRVPIVNIPGTEKTLLFETPKCHIFDVVAVSFIDDVAVSMSFVGRNPSTREQLFACTEEVEDAKLDSILLIVGMERMLRMDDEYWYNMRYDSDKPTTGVTVTSKKMFP